MAAAFSPLSAPSSSSMSPSLCAALIWKRIVSSPLRDDWEGQPHGEDASLEESSDHRPDAAVSRTSSGTTGCGPGIDSNPSASSPRAELRRARVQVRESRASVRGVRDVDRLHRRRAVGRTERVRIDVGVGLLPYRLDELRGSPPRTRRSRRTLSRTCRRRCPRARRSVPRSRAPFARRPRCRASRP